MNEEIERAAKARKMRRRQVAVAAMVFLAILLWKHDAVAGALPRHLVADHGEHLVIQRNSQDVFGYRTLEYVTPPGYEVVEEYMTTEYEERFYEKANGKTIELLLTYPEFAVLREPEGVVIENVMSEGMEYSTYQKDENRYVYGVRDHLFLQVSGTAEEAELKNVFESVKSRPVAIRAQIDSPRISWLMILVSIVTLWNVGSLVWRNRFLRYEKDHRRAYQIMVASFVIMLIAWVGGILFGPFRQGKAILGFLMLAPVFVIGYLYMRLRPERERLENEE